MIGRKDTGLIDRTDRFVVITTQRTGSSWFMDRLNAVDGVAGHMELFYELPRRSPPMAGCNNFPRYVEIHRFYNLGRRPRSTFGYLDDFFALPGVTGFKLMYSQLRRYPEILLYLARRRVPIIHLIRENSLDIVISETLAGITGRSHTVVGKGVTRPSRIALDPGSLPEQIRRIEHKRALVRAVLKFLPNPVLELSYENLCDSKLEIRKALDFLGMPAAPGTTKSRLVKRNRAPHPEMIENYGEIRMVLIQSKLDYLLKERAPN